MTKARRTEGPRAPLFYWAAALLLLSAKITNAQTVDLSTLEFCASLETQELKLACFEAIIASSKTPVIRQSEAVDIPLSEPPVAEIDAVSKAQPTAEVMRQEAPDVDAATDSTPAVVTTSTAAVAVTMEPTAAAQSVKPEPSSATVGTTPSPVAGDQLGEEHLERLETEEKANEDEVFYARVSEVTKGRNRILYFHFDNGQVWRQNEARHLEYPRSGEFDINITRGMMGDYRMRIGDNGRLVRIRRVQ
jgi:hypothetical protein